MSLRKGVRQPGGLMGVFGKCIVIVMISVV